jgi:hypothetical protein
MKSKLDPQTTPEQKFENFEKALKTVLSVSKEELQKRIDEDKSLRSVKPKRGPKPRQLATSNQGHN